MITIETAHHHHCLLDFKPIMLLKIIALLVILRLNLNPFPSPGEGSRGDSSHHQWFKDLHTVLGAFVEKKVIIIFQTTQGSRTFRSFGKSISAQLPSSMFLHFKLKSGSKENYVVENVDRKLGLQLTPSLLVQNNNVSQKSDGSPY